MDWILSRLACGSLVDVAALEHISGIQRVLTLSEQRRPPLPSLMYGHHEAIPDEVWLPPDLWERRVESLRYLLVHGTVLVHCRLGISRAPALCAAYLIRCGMAAEEAHAFVQSKRPVTNIHPETWRGVLEWAEGVS